MTWRIVFDGAAAVAWNMACDAALLEAAQRDGTRTLRLYAWDAPTLSFGRHEPARRRYDRAAIEARGLAAVRRPTGGRAVLHHHEVTYSVTAPTETFGSLRDTYLEVHALIAAALRSLGAAVSLAPPRPAAGVGAGACFASAAGGEVVAAGGRKLVGSAQVRQARAFLQHGSILLSADQDMVASLTLGASDPSAAIGLASLVPARTADWPTVAAALASVAQVRWGARRAGLPAGVVARAATLRRTFADAAWTWRR